MPRDIAKASQRMLVAMELRKTMINVYPIGYVFIPQSHEVKGEEALGLKVGSKDLVVLNKNVLLNSITGLPQFLLLIISWR